MYLRRKVSPQPTRRNIRNPSLPHDTVILQLRDLRTLESIIGKRIADLVLPSTFLEPLNELVVDTLLDIDSRSSTAALAVVEEDSEVDPRDGIFDISIVEDDVRALASQLKRHLLQIRASSGLHDLATDDSATGEGDFVDVHVRGDGCTGDLAEAGDDVDDSWWEASFLDELGGVKAGKGGLFGGLEDDDVSTGDCGANLPCPPGRRKSVNGS